MKERFSRPKGLSKEEIEREAEKELARLTRNAPGPSAGGGFGGLGGAATPLDQIADSVRSGGPAVPEPNLGVLGSAGAGPGGYRGGPGDFDRGLGGYGGPSAHRGGPPGQGPAPGLPADFEDPEEESATITELALRDLAARDGTNPEDLVIRQDPGMAEAMRDEAMRRFFDRQQSRQPAASAPRIDPANTVLGRLAARRKAAEEGREIEEDRPSGGGLLDRLRQRQEAQEAASTGPPGGGPARVGSLQDRRAGKGNYEVDDDDDYDGPQGLRARVTARRRDESNAGNRSARVFAMPSPDDQGSTPELAAMASRLYQSRAKTGRARSGAAPAKKKAPAARPATRAAKKTHGKRAAPSSKRASTTKEAGKASTAKRSAKKAAVAKAVAKKTAAGRRAAGASKPVRSSTARASGAAPVKKNTVSTTKRVAKRTTRRR